VDLLFDHDQEYAVLAPTGEAFEAAAVTRADIPAQNGVVHVIDAVLQPTGEVELGG
jgi:uncharacterized surface protein with fasciclin (FAS1) repeats